MSNTAEKFRSYSALEDALFEFTIFGATEPMRETAIVSGIDAWNLSLIVSGINALNLSLVLVEMCSQNN